MPKTKPPGRRRPAPLFQTLYCALGVTFVALPLAGWVETVGLVAYFLAAEALALFGSATETALNALSRGNLLTLARVNGHEAVTEKRLARLGTYRLTARLARFLGNASLVVGVAFVAFGDVLRGGGAQGVLPLGSVLVVLGITFSVTFLVNDVIVRQIVSKRPDQFIYATFPAIEVMRWVLAPLRLPLVLLVQLAFGVRLEASGPTVREEVLESVEEGEREGMLSASEADMIESIMEFERSQVKDVMTLRMDMVMISADATLDEAVDVFTEHAFSRVPVYEEDRDDVVGVLYARDLLSHRDDIAGGQSKTQVRDVMRTDPFFVPENKHIGPLLSEMRTMQVHLAIVTDEFRGTVGLVTIEDLIEEIVGEIRDEYDDEEEEEATVTPEPIGDNAFQLEGRAPVEDVNRALSVELPVYEDFETLSGLLFHQLGNVPQVGDRVDLEGVALTVLEADERTVKRVKVEVPSNGHDVDDA